MSDKTFAKKVFRTETNGDVFIAKAEIRSLSGQHPYFSVTGELYDRDYIRGEDSTVNSNGKKRYLGSCGAMGDEVEQRIPELAPYVRWHLTSTDGPLHYLGNAIYHAGFVLGMENSRNLDHLKSTVVYGAVEGDLDVDIAALDAEQLKQWLTDRFPALMRQFQADMLALFGEISELPEIATEVQAYNGTLSTPHNREVMRQKKRQSMIDAAEKKTQEQRTDLEGHLWALDHGLNIENLIYYSHRDIFTFGWREPVSDTEKSKILDVISEFPFEYEIKTREGVLSGRE